MFRHSYLPSFSAQVKQFIAKHDTSDTGTPYMLESGLYTNYGYRNTKEMLADVNFSVFGDYDRAYIPGNPGNASQHPIVQEDLGDNDA